MVKVGFIVEGDCEKIIIESPQFKQFLLSCGFELVTPVINAAGVVCCPSRATSGSVGFCSRG